MSLVEQVQMTVATETVDLPWLVRSLDGLLQHYLLPKAARMRTVAMLILYFMKHEEWAEGSLPDAIHDIFADMSGALHDTCSAPDVAQNFDSTPEQLLARLGNISTEQFGSANAG